MKLTTKELKVSLSEILPKYEWETQEIENQTHTYVRFKKIIDLKEALKLIDDLDFFTDEMAKIKLSGLLEKPGDVFDIANPVGQLINQELSDLRRILYKLSDILRLTVPDEDQNSINIKLPPYVSDFGDLEKVSHDLHIALSQLVHHNEIGGQEKIVSVENGSIWVNVLVGEAAVLILGKVIWAATVIYKNMQQGKLLESQARIMKVKEDSLRDIQEAQQAYTKIMIEAEAEHIQTENFKENAPENLERIKVAIKIFAELIDKGAEIHPALVAPENVANLFPKAGNLLSVESKVKRIGNGNEKS